MGKIGSRDGLLVGLDGEEGWLVGGYILVNSNVGTLKKKVMIS